MSEEFELKFKAEIDGREDIASFFDDAGRGADRFGSRLQSMLKGSGAAISAFAGKAKSELQSFAGKELGGSLGSQARGVLELRDAINKLTVTSGGGAEMFSSLDAQIQKVSVSTNQLQTDVTEALSAFVERSGDIETARRNIELYGKTATATSASLEDVARVGEALSSKFGIKNQAQSFSVLAAQAKAGAIELRDVATQGSSIFTAARAANIGGKGHEEEGVREIGGLLQVIAGGARGKGKSTAADTAVQITAMFSQIRQKASQIEGIGIKVGDRDYIDVIKDMIVKSNGDPRKLAEVFKNERAFRGISTLATLYKDQGGFGALDKFVNIQSDPSLLDRDFATRNSTGAARLRQQQISRTALFDKYLGGVTDFAAEHATSLQIGATALGFAGKGLGLLGGALGGRVGGALGAATAQRVFVVNWPGALGGGAGGGAAGALGNVSQFLGAAGAGVALGGALGLYLDKHSTAASKFYSGEANLIDRVSGSGAKRQALENSGVELNRLQLQRLKGEREDLIRDFEAKGLNHGRAVFAADQRIAEIKNLTVNINDDKAHVENENGTRSPEILVKRNGGGG